MAHTYTRRFTLLGAAAGALAFTTRPGMASLVTDGADNLDFDVFRNGSDIGHHRITLSQDGDRTIADIDILLEVGIGPLVLYRYTHRNREIWQGGEFQSFESVTDDDGDAYAVRAVRDGGVIRVERDHDEDYETDDLTLLPTTYWNAATVTRPRLLDTQKGRIMEVAIDQGDWQPIQTATGMVEARRFDVEGDLKLSLWYDRQGRWTKLFFPLKGDEFDYVLA